MWLRPAGLNRFRRAMVVAASVFIVVPMMPVPNRSASAEEAPTLAFPFRNTVDQLAETLNLRAKPGAVPEFVRRTRPDRAKMKFIPIGLPRPVRPLPVKTVDEVQAMKDKLDAAAASQLAPRPAPADPASKHRGRKAAKTPAPEATADHAAAPQADPTN